MTPTRDGFRQAAIAAGYQEGSERTARTATGLEAAMVLLEHMDIERVSPELADRFAEAGLTGSVEQLHAAALESVGGKATMERNIANGMAATAQEARDKIPPPPPGPAPAGLGHPEGGGLGFLTQ